MRKELLNKNLQNLPAIDKVLNQDSIKVWVAEIGGNTQTAIVRKAVEVLRNKLIENYETGKTLADLSKEHLLQAATENAFLIYNVRENKKLRKVVNATGVLIHTNLGRVPLSEASKQAITESSSSYCNLEFDLSSGARGARGDGAEVLLCELTGAEDALIVNNCAAATVLVLSSLSNGGEVIISRGELVEIGGDFRVPDVMNVSGAKLVEIGTTNRTKLQDYEMAITHETSLILKVHPSNYKIIGFTESPEVAELARLAQKNDILLYEDAGSGAMVDLSEYGLGDEPLIKASIEAGADVVTFSGDKLLGSVQAGLIVGKARAISRLRKNPLYRALRGSKIIYAALEATFKAYIGNSQFTDVPVLRMLTEDYDELEIRAKNLVGKLSKIETVGAEIKEGFSAIGGGAAPEVKLHSPLISASVDGYSTSELLNFLRNFEVPVIARIFDENLLMDLRTVSETEESILLEAFQAASRLKKKEKATQK
ncbi:MAG: L-seryl-tRNA(Sec) selenium transferase [Pyrinomonadaceae bacterium]